MREGEAEGKEEGIHTARRVRALFMAVSCWTWFIIWVFISAEEDMFAVWMCGYRSSIYSAVLERWA